MTRTLEDKISESENKHFQAGWQAALDFMKNREEKINNSVSGKEDVKLPEVGKKYRNKFSFLGVEYTSNNYVKVKKIEFGRVIFYKYASIALKTFWKHYEELPEDNIRKN